MRLQGFKYYVEAEDPDVLILTETKVSRVPCIGHAHACFARSRVAHNTAEPCR